MKNFLKNLKINENNVSMLLGIVVVLIVGGLLVNYFRSVNKTPETSSSTTETVQAGETPKLENLPAEYTVQKGDTLWLLSEKVYGTGYNWSDVYEENKETIGSNPNVLTEGTKLTMPKVEPKLLSATSSDSVEIEASEHTVVKGDNLWKIAVQYCQDGYSWSTIAKANNFAEPNLIEVGQVVKISCR